MILGFRISGLGPGSLLNQNNKNGGYIGVVWGSVWGGEGGWCI